MTSKGFLNITGMTTGIAWAREQRPENQIRADQCTFFDIDSTENKHKSHMSVFRNML